MGSIAVGKDADLVLWTHNPLSIYAVVDQTLIDGTQPRECSLRHCGVRPMSVSEAWQVKLHGPSDPEAREAIDPDRRWWIEP